MPRTRVLKPSPALKRARVHIQASPAVEFLMSLMAFASQSPKTVDSDTAWFRSLRALCSSDLLEALTRLEKANQLWSNLLQLLWRGRLLQEPRLLIERVAASDPHWLRVALLSHHTSGARKAMGEEAFLAAAQGDIRQQQRMLRLQDPYDETGDTSWLRPYLSLGVEETQGLALDILSRWDTEVFAHLRQGLEPVLSADAEEKRRMAESMSSEELIFSATAGLDYVPQSGVERVVLTPQVAMRPWNIVRAYPGVVIFCYPVTHERLAVTAADSSARLAQLYKALGDEKRLRILQILARSDASLDELARDLHVGKPLILYHLGVLRSAGLVRTGSDYKGWYRLRRESIPEAGPGLEGLLQTGPS
jgi:DNA-binding transcriptional ArsR family regulator